MHIQPIMPKKLYQILILIFLILLLTSCHTTKSTATSSESAQNSVEQVQRRSAQKCSSDSIWRFTALSIDSLTLVFKGGDKSATHEYELPACPESNDFIANNPKPSAFSIPNPSAINKPTASAVTLYGIHLSHEEKENAVAEAQVSDSSAQSVQSSHDNAQSNAKRQSPISNSFSTITNSLSSLLILLIMTTAIILYIRNKLRK